MTISSKTVKARKRHLCDGCNHTIFPGEKYTRKYGSFEDDPPYVIKICNRCEEPTV